MLKPDIFLKNRLLNKDYHHNECLKELQHKKKIPNAINSSRAVYELKKPTEKFDLFMRKTFTRELKTPKSAIKPISLNSVTQNSNFLDIRRGSLFNPNNKEKDIISSQNSKKQLRFSQNNISSSEDEIQLSKMKRDLTFSSHLQELRNLKEDQKLDRKINKINELQREKNRKLSKRMSILKFITALKSSKNLLNGNFHINPIVSPNNLSNMDNKRYFSLMADLNNMIEKLSKNIQILLDRAGGNRMLIAKSLKKQKGYNEVIGNLLLDPKKIELSPNLTKEELTKKIEKHIVGSRAVCLGFLDKVNYFNNNLNENKSLKKKKHKIKLDKKIDNKKQQQIKH